MTTSDKINNILEYLDINAKVFSEKLGYKRPQIIYDLQKGKTKTISPELEKKILSVFPCISKAWLVLDEGDMIQSPITQESNGDHNTQVAGNHNHVEPPHGIEKALDEIAAQRKLVSKAQEQIDRLLTVIENLTNTTTKQ